MPSAAPDPVLTAGWRSGASPSLALLRVQNFPSISPVKRSTTQCRVMTTIDDPPAVPDDPIEATAEPLQTGRRRGGDEISKYERSESLLSESVASEYEAIVDGIFEAFNLEAIEHEAVGDEAIEDACDDEAVKVTEGKKEAFTICMGLE